MGGGGEGGGIPTGKGRGVLVGNFEKKTLRGINILCCEGVLIFFVPLRGSNSKSTH